MAGILKKTTRLTGLAVCKEPHYELHKVYTKILNALRNYPPDYPYRKHTEKIVQERADILKNNSDVKVCEEKIGCGQIEEVLVQAKNELRLVLELYDFKPWESTIEPPPNQWIWPPHK